MTTKKARKYFENNSLSYADVGIDELYYLIKILNKEMIDDDILIMMKEPIFKGRDKTIVLDKNKKIVFAALKCKGDYFDSREAITFNKNGFIGFCGWADDKRTDIFTRGFKKWCEYLKFKKFIKKGPYQEFLEEKLSENVEPDPEDFYLAEIEGKAQDYDKYKLVLNEIREYCKKKIQKSFNYDYGLDVSNSSDRLFTETIMELQVILDMIDKVAEIKNENER